MTRSKRMIIRTGVFLVLLVFGSPSAWAAQALLHWNPNSETDFGGYIVSVGTASGSYFQDFDVGPTTTPDYPSQTVTGLTEGQTYYFAVRAYDTSGNTSDYSAEAFKSIPAVDTVAPTPPLDLTGTYQDPDAAVLVWGASTDGGGTGTGGYHVERCTGELCSDFIQVATTSGTSQMDTGLSAGMSYRYRVSAFDNAGNESDYSNIVSVTAPVVDLPPISEAGPDPVVWSRQSVTIDGSGSIDPEGSPLSYAWMQTSGPAALLNHPDQSIAWFLPDQAGTYVFALTVSDGVLESGSDSVRITVNEPVHSIPEADAGANQIVESVNAVTLDGGLSHDSDSGSLTFTWYQVEGAPVDLMDADTANPWFVPVDSRNYAFELIVDNGFNESLPDRVNIYVVDKIVATTTVSPKNGGSISIFSGDFAGFQMAFPPGAVQEETEIAVGQEFDLPLLNGQKFVQLPATFEPAGTQFGKPVTVTFPYDIGTTKNTNSLKAYLYDETADEWNRVPILDINSNKGLVTAQIEHFSSFALVTEEDTASDSRSVQDSGDLDVGFGCGMIRTIGRNGGPPQWPGDFLLLMSLIVWIGVGQKIRKEIRLKLKAFTAIDFSSSRGYFVGYLWRRIGFPSRFLFIFGPFGPRKEFPNVNPAFQIRSISGLSLCRSATALAVVSVFLIIGLSPSMSHALLKEADFEEGDASDFQTLESPNKADTFANFGIPALPGGGNYCISNNSTGGVDDAKYSQHFYNKNALANGYLRFYFYLPENFTGNLSKANTIKFALLRGVGSGDQDLYLYQNTSGKLKFNWQHAAAGYNSGSIMDTAIERSMWHYIEVNIDTTTETIRIWFDTDSSGPPTWTNEGTGDLDYPMNTSIIQFNDNWSGGLAPQTQVWYLDGVSWSDSPIGDTYGLLGAPAPPPPPPPPPDTTPPQAPSGVTVE